MGVLDDIVDFLLGDHDWKARLKEKIEFVSPEGREFSAFWKGSPRSLDKKVGIFAYPKVVGNIVQDLDANSTRFDITFWFEGKDNDKEANQFFAAAKENGNWTVTHPVHGFFELQLLSITENDQPVDAGNITEISTTWIEGIDPITLKTAREAAGIVDAKSKDLNQSALDQFIDGVNTASSTANEAIKTASKAVTNASNFALSPVAALNDAVWNTQNAIQQGIIDTTNAAVLDPLALAGQLQNLLEYPALATNDVESRLDAYDELINQLVDNLPGGANDPFADSSGSVVKKNSALTQELGMNAALVGIGTSVTTGKLKTRVQSVDTASRINDSLTRILNGLDAIQEDSLLEDIDNQYISNQQSLTDATGLIGEATRYLLISSFDLKVERRFTLEKPRAPIEITITEYGDLGENDENLDLFIESNQLTGKDILLLPAGKEVVVYI